MTQKRIDVTYLEPSAWSKTDGYFSLFKYVFPLICTVAAYFDHSPVFAIFVGAAAVWFIPEFWPFRALAGPIMRGRCSITSRLMVLVLGWTGFFALVNVVVFHTVGQTLLGHLTNGTKGIAPNDVIWYGIGTTLLWLLFEFLRPRVRKLIDQEFSLADQRRRDMVAEINMKIDRRLLKPAYGKGRPN